MAVKEKFYQLTPESLKNVICDVAEMRKAKITRPGGMLEVEMITEMYRIKTSYIFRMTREKTGTTLSIESGNGDDNSVEDVEFMFVILDGMIDPFKGHTVSIG